MLKSKEIEYIIDTYKNVKSVTKTSKITRFSNRTVNRYVVEYPAKINAQDIANSNLSN